MKYSINKDRTEITATPNADKKHGASASFSNDLLYSLGGIMNDFIRFEIKAEAFRLSTGFLAPGKDVAAGANEGEEDQVERSRAWVDWCIINNSMFNKFIKAAEGVGVE